LYLSVLLSVSGLAPAYAFQGIPSSAPLLNVSQAPPSPKPSPTPSPKPTDTESNRQCQAGGRYFKNGEMDLDGKQICYNGKWEKMP
ncbi:MAG: hypothetical protein WCD18_24500, partial [Thermosynechococcaceae cyanobacterium]